MRIVRTTLAGYRTHRDHPDARVRDRFEWEAKDLPTVWAAAVSAARKYFANRPGMHQKMSDLLDELIAEFGFKAKLAATFGGPFVRWKMRGEQRRLDRGATSEPPTFFESNQPDSHLPTCQFVEPTQCTAARV
jgi:hypothetical protein